MGEGFKTSCKRAQGKSHSHSCSRDRELHYIAHPSHRLKADHYTDEVAVAVAGTVAGAGAVAVAVAVAVVAVALQVKQESLERELASVKAAEAE